MLGGGPRAAPVSRLVLWCAGVFFLFALAIRAAQFNEGAQYFALRELVDQTILNVRTGFYQVLLDRAW